jgi:hypothetical protein
MQTAGGFRHAGRCSDAVWMQAKTAHERDGCGEATRSLIDLALTQHRAISQRRGELAAARDGRTQSSALRWVAVD